MSVVEDYTPVYVGDTGAIFAPQFQHKDGSFVDLTYATISMKMQLAGSSTTKTCSGTWIIDSAIDGIAHYQYQSNDVSTAGTWTLYTVITIGGAPIHADSKPLVILPAP